MDSVFFLDEVSRPSFLQTLMPSFGCAYVCVWSYLSEPSKCLVFLDGLYEEGENTQLPSSSSPSTSMAAKFFNQYRRLVFSVEDGLVPGLSIKGNISCLHLNQSELQSLSSADSQRQFYEAARIKTSVFLGSIYGEIELGFSTVLSVVMMQTLMNNLIPGDFTPRVIPVRSYQNLPSSSSSSLRSLSMENSLENFSILNKFQKTSPLAEPTTDNPLSTKQKTSNTAPPHQLAMDLFAHQFNLQFPTREREHAAMTNALINVLSSTSSSSSSSSPQPAADQGQSGSSRAFKKYASSSLFQKSQTTDGLRRRSMFNRSIEFFRSFNLAKIGERLHGNRPSNYHLQHKILERHRRKKHNENFQALRSLLPPTTKKDRDSVLKAAREEVISLKAEVAELRKKNQTLMEPQLFADKKETGENETTNISNTPTETFSVRVTHVLNESPSEGLTVDLQIDLIGDYPLEHTIIRILEFLKHIQNLSLMSMEANTQTTGSTSISHLTYRLNIKGMEWDDASFQEAIRRIVSDVAP